MGRPRHCRSVYVFDFTIENDDRPFCHIVAEAMRKAADLTEHGPLSDSDIGTTVIDGVTVCQETKIERLG